MTCKATIEVRRENLHVWRLDHRQVVSGHDRSRAERVVGSVVGMQPVAYRNTSASLIVADPRHQPMLALGCAT